MNLDTMVALCYSAAIRKGFWDVPPGVDGIMPRYELMKKLEKLALITSEVGEAIEAIRKLAQISPHIQNFTFLIRLLDYCGGFNIRIEEAFEAKMRFNETRPSKHGKLV